jgi:glutaredoxin 3
MSKNITVYTTATCGYCHMLKSYLNEKKIKYTEKMVDQNQQFAEEMVEKSGQRGVPFSVITDESGNEKGILGYDISGIEHALAN